MENESTNKSLAIYHFLEAQLHLFMEHFKTTSASLDAEAIHQMRVAIKRIRTIRKLKKHIHFPSVLSDEQYVKLKAFFAVSGQMRDIQIQKKLLKVYAEEITKKNGGIVLEDFAIYLDLLESDNAAKLNTSIQNFNLNQFCKPVHTDELKPQLDHDIDLETESIDFLHSKINKINGLILLLDKDEFVHDLRKQVKQAIFILQFLEEHFNKKKFRKYKLKAMKNFGEQLGIWNDLDMLIKHLDEFLQTKGKAFLNDHREYQLLRHQLDVNKQKMLGVVDTYRYGEMLK